MNAGKLFGIIILLIFLLFIFGIIIKVSFCMMADVLKDWFVLMYGKCSKLVKVNWFILGA